MRRPTVRRQQPGVALFPFLAVLICTMGSLIVLLVLVVQQARTSAAAEVAVTTPPPPAIGPEELKRLVELEEDLQWRAEMLKEQQVLYAKDLADKRAELAHLEDHIRRLEDQAKKLMAQAEAMQKAGKNKLADRDGAKEQLAELEREIEAKKKELDEARKEILRRRPAYAIIPYDGPNGTSRRPMYIECTAEGIVLQPEGVVLSAADFDGPMGPGNPLDAALRATREHLKRAGLQAEPYPLIVVRPNGAIAFGAARNAMKHWESEFGYELIDEETELKYPPADPQLTATLERAVADARQRQMALAAAMPKRFSGAEGRLASFRPEDNAFGEGEDGVSSGGGTGYARPGTSGVPSKGTGGTGQGTGPRGATGSGGSGMYGAGSIGDRPPSAGTSPRYASSASGTGGQQISGAGSPGTGTSAASQPRGNGPSGQNGTGGTSYAGGSPGGNAPNGASSPQGAGATSTNSSGARSGSPGSTAGSRGGAASGASSNTSSANSDSSSGQPSPSMNFSPTSKDRLAKARKAMKNRGVDWGLINASPKATAVSRPIFVECYADQLKLLPEQGDARTPLVVPLEDDMSQNLDVLLDSVWRHMDRWGLAVLGGYWKPVLKIDVKPGGEERFMEMQMLLRGSGIDVERKTP